MLFESGVYMTPHLKVRFLVFFLGNDNENYFASHTIYKDASFCCYVVTAVLNSELITTVLFS